MVMDYMDRDVKALMTQMTQAFTQAEVKCLMLQLLSGVAYMHEHWVIHRDLKTSNLLMYNSGRLAICDFGLARKYGSPLRPYTETVVTQWYRSPELLLGEKLYSTAVDMWSVGCIFAELLTRKPLWPGKTEPEQVELIFRTMGTPTEENWPGWTALPHARHLRMRPRTAQPLRAALGLGISAFSGTPFISDTGIDLLRRLLCLDPVARISAAVALRHPWFAESPPPTDPRLMPTFPDADEQQFGHHAIISDSVLGGDGGAGSSSVEAHSHGPAGGFGGHHTRHDDHHDGAPTAAGRPASDRQASASRHRSADHGPSDASSAATLHDRGNAGRTAGGDSVPAGGRASAQRPAAASKPAASSRYADDSDEEHSPRRR
jgi:cell division cycle 2-like protein